MLECEFRENGGLKPALLCPTCSLTPASRSTASPTAVTPFPDSRIRYSPNASRLRRSRVDRTLNNVSAAPLNEPPRRVFGRIAIIDDNPDDIFLLQHLLFGMGVRCPTATFSDGHDAMAFLKQTAAQHGPGSLPEILFLDINMPGATGFSVLCWLREQDELKHLKVVILSGTSDPGDVALATALSADAYVAKEPSPEHLTTILTRFAPGLLPQPASPTGELADRRLLRAS